MSSGDVGAMTRAVGIAVALTLFAIALLHAFWAAGGHWGAAVAVPSENGEPMLRPSAFATLLVAGLLTAASAVVLGRIGIWGSALPDWPFVAGSWTLAIVFAARVVGDLRWCGIFKQVRDSDFAYWDTRLFVPLCAMLAAGCVIVALAGGRQTAGEL